MMRTASPIQDATVLKPFSVMDIFSIGIGPSSSHTVGPMRAAYQFASGFSSSSGFAPTSILVELFGSLALTGIGHRTHAGIMLGLSGWRPEQVDPDQIDNLIQDIRTKKSLNLNGSIPVPFVEAEHLIFHRN
jgi:L-serine dehydratase